MTIQKTLKSGFKLSGNGLHSGNAVNVFVKPAPVNTGIVFTRVDDSHRVQAKAIVPNVDEATSQGLRQTTLKCGNNKIQTIEHLMAALTSSEITNAFIDIDSDELPALDGSALEYVNAINAVGTKEQSEQVQRLVVTKKIVVAANGATIMVEPFEGFKVSYTLDYNHLDLNKQIVSFDISKEIFASQIAPARTFCLKEEAEALQKMGFGKGASEKNTLVFKDNLPINNKLRFLDEAARHKVLDLLGDISLVGMPISGHIIAEKSGHVQNFKLAKKLFELIKC